MGLWRNITRLANAGAVQGVIEPGPTDILTPAQAVQVIDDITTALPPLDLPIFEIFPNVPAVAGERGVAIFTPGPRGTWIIAATAVSNAGALVQDNSFSTHAIGTITPDTATGTQVTQVFNAPGGVAPTPRFSMVTGTIAASPYNAFGRGFRGISDVAYTELGWFLKDRELLINNVNVNTLWTMSLLVQDIP